MYNVNPQALDIGRPGKGSSYERKFMTQTY